MRRVEQLGGSRRSVWRRRGLEMVTGTILLGVVAWYAYARWGLGSSTGELNISCFAYRDVNRNGIYDVPDRPYAGLRVTLQGPRGASVTTQSNIAGFANFPMSARSWSAPVARPGGYTFTVTAPEGWVVTSRNARQTTSFVLLDSAPAGIVAESTLTPVGVAPELSISGAVLSHGGVPGTTLRAVAPDGSERDVPVSGAGTFSFPVVPGEWGLAFLRGHQIVARRSVHVGHYAVVLSRVEPGARVPDAKPVLRRADFDALTSSDTLYEIPTGYLGLDWTNWVATHHKLYESAGMVNGTVSAEYFAYNSSGHPATIASSRAFDLAGVYLGVAWPRAEPHGIEIRAWRDTRLVYADVVTARTAGPIHFDADYRDVTRVDVRSRAYWQVVIDDLEFRTDEDPALSPGAAELPAHPRAEARR